MKKRILLLSFVSVVTVSGLNLNDVLKDLELFSLSKDPQFTEKSGIYLHKRDDNTGFIISAHASAESDPIEFDLRAEVQCKDSLSPDEKARCQSLCESLAAVLRAECDRIMADIMNKKAVAPVVVVTATETE